MTATKETIGERKKVKEEKEEIGEEDLAEIKKWQDDDEAYRNPVIENYMKNFPGRCNVIQLKTDDSLETTYLKLKGLFSPKVILLNHEKRLGTHVTCCNLAIKYNFIYLSAYQIIKEHIENETEWGKKLLLTKRARALNLTTQVKDEFSEAEFSPALFDQTIVMELLRSVVADKRTDQKYVLLEGLCSTTKLSNEEDKLELRLMDEYLAVEKHVGSIAAVIGLQFTYEPEVQQEDEMVFDEAVEGEEKFIVK